MLTCLYFALAFVSGGYIMTSFILGEVVDFGADVSHSLDGLAHDFGDSIGHAFDGIFHGSDSAHVDFSGHDHGTGSGTHSVFSLRTVCMFTFGFGGGGLIGKGAGMNDMMSTIPAFGTGLVLGILMWFVLKTLYNAEGTTSIQDNDFLGLVARVTVSIPENGRGMVAVNVKGQRMNIPAISEGGGPIPSNAEVEVISKEGGAVIVKPT